MTRREDYQELINHLKADLCLAIAAQMGIRRVEECDRKLWVMLRSDPDVASELRLFKPENRPAELKID